MNFILKFNSNMNMVLKFNRNIELWAFTRWSSFSQSSRSFPPKRCRPVRPWRERGDPELTSNDWRTNNREQTARGQILQPKTNKKNWTSCLFISKMSGFVKFQNIGAVKEEYKNLWMNVVFKITCYFNE